MPIFLIVVGVLSILTRIALLNDWPVDDEYFHILVAENWLQNRQLTMLDGQYERGAFFTKLVALSFGMFGDTSWQSARIFPSMVWGVLLVILMVGWTHREVGSIAALVAAVLLILWPVGIEVSQFARFYALHGFLVGAAVVLFYYVCTGTRLPTWLRIAMGLLSGVCVFIALGVQVLTIASVLGMGVWLSVFFILPNLTRAWTLALGGAIVIGAVAIISLGLHEPAQDLWRLYRLLPPGWSYDGAFYHRYLRDAYPTFWPLFILIAIIALNARPRLAFLCLAIFLTAFVMLSFGHRVHLRYVYHAMPFLFITWAIAIQYVFNGARDFLYDGGDEVAGLVLSGRLRRMAALALVMLAISFAGLSNAAFPRAARLALGKSGGELLRDVRVAWPEAYEQLQPYAKDGALFLTSRTMISTAYIGDFDVAFSRLSVHDISGGEKDETTLGFVVDPRDGRPLIGNTNELLRLVLCTPVGVAISPAYKPDFDRIFFVEGRDLPLETVIDENRNVRLIGWRTLETPDAADCEGLPIPQDGGAAARILSGQSVPAMGPSRPDAAS